MAIPQFKMNVNDPSTWGEIEGTQEQTKRRFVTFKGRTLDATPTELFIDGVTNYRLKVHDTGVMTAIAQGLVLGPTAATSGGATFTGIAATNFAGATVMTTAVTITKVGGATWTGAGPTIAITASDANDALTVTVTGIAATVMDWEVTLWVAELSSDAGQLGV